MKKLSLLIIVMHINYIFGQELIRKASFGIDVISINDSIANIKNLTINKGVLITRLLSNTTSEKLGLKQGDVITKINNETILERSQVFAMARNLREGNKLIIEFNRGNQAKKVRGIAVGKPKETSKHGEVIYGSIDTKLGVLRTIIHKPKIKKKLPVIFFMQGIYCGSQDFWAIPTDPIKLLIDDWVEAGYSVYRVERPGIGDSQNSLQCRDITYSQELELHEEAYNDLLSLPFVDTSKVFLFGHSMGSITAPLLAKDYQPTGIMVYGAIFKTWFEYFIDNFRLQPTFYGVETKLQIDEMVRSSIPILYRLLILKKSPNEIRENPDNKRFVEKTQSAFNYIDNDYFFGRHYKFWQTLNEIDNARSWGGVSTNVLAIYGSADIQALGPESAKDIVTLCNEVSPGKATFLKIPEADHLFAKIKSKEEGAKLVLSGNYTRYIRENYNSEIAVKTIGWMNELIKK